MDTAPRPSQEEENSLKYYNHTFPMSEPQSDEARPSMSNVRKRAMEIDEDGPPRLLLPPRRLLSFSNIDNIIFLPLRVSCLKSSRMNRFNQVPSSFPFPSSSQESGPRSGCQGSRPIHEVESKHCYCQAHSEEARSFRKD